MPEDGTAADLTPVDLTPADTPATEQPTPAPTRGAEVGDVVPRSARSLLWQARIGLGVGLLGLALAVFFYLDTTDLRSAEATRADVLEAAEIMALRVTTFSGESIDDWVADTQSLATGDYADEVATLFDVEIRQGLADNQVQSVGQVTSSFVQEVDDDRAIVFAVLRQTFTSLNQPQPISDELRMEIGLQRVDGEWLTSEVAVLGPSTVSPVAADDTPGTTDVPSEGDG